MEAIRQEFMNLFWAAKDGREIDRDRADELYSIWEQRNPGACIKCDESLINGWCRKCGFEWTDRRGILPDQLFIGPEWREREKQQKDPEEIKALQCIADKLKAAIQAKGITQVFISRKMGHHKYWVSDSLSKHSIERMRIIAEWLGVKIG